MKESKRRIVNSCCTSRTFQTSVGCSYLSIIYKENDIFVYTGNNPLLERTTASTEVLILQMWGLPVEMFFHVGISRIWGSHSCSYEGYFHLGNNVMQASEDNISEEHAITIFKAEQENICFTLVPCLACPSTRLHGVISQKAELIDVHYFKHN